MCVFCLELLVSAVLESSNFNACRSDLAGKPGCCKCNPEGMILKGSDSVPLPITPDFKLCHTHTHTHSLSLSQTEGCGRQREGEKDKTVGRQG